MLEQLSLADPEALLLEIDAGIAALAGYEITSDDIEIRRVEKDGFAAQTLSLEEGDVSIVLDMHTDQELLSKGLARDITRRVQAKRKELDLQVESSIEISLWVLGIDLEDTDRDYIKSETRTSKLYLNEGDPIESADKFEVDETEVFFRIH